MTQPDGSFQFIEVTPSGEVKYIQLDANTALSDSLADGSLSQTDGHDKQESVDREEEESAIQLQVLFK